jgi:ribosomal protein L11 methyltransferase
MAQWVEVSLRVDGEAAEAAASELQKWCHQGVSLEHDAIEPDKYDDGEVPEPKMLILRGYFAADSQAETIKTEINRAIGYLNMMYPMPQPTYGLVDEEDWANAWKAHYHPVRIGKHLLIRPLWIDLTPADDDVVIALDPGMAFGTGTHPTTQLCLEAIEDLMQPHLDVLDLGCGSGILAIAAAKLGGNKIVGVDVEERAVTTTMENAEVNGVADRIQAHQGSIETLLPSARRFDFMLVNILAKVIIAMCGQGLGQLVRPGGKAIFSGIIDTQGDEVEAALREAGLEPYKRRQQGDWILIEATRPHVS